MRALALPLVAVLLAPPSAAFADEGADKARTAFLEGTALVEKAQWAEALAAFERAREQRPHPVTTFNMAACERAMGRYTRARERYGEALTEHAAATEDGKRLPKSLVTEARALIAEIDHALVRATLTVQPEGSTVAVDGRPLLATSGELVAGLRAPGPGEATPPGSFVVVLDPGPHVFMFARRGFRDVTLPRTFEAGRAESIRLELTQIPATIRVSASQPGSIVTIDGSDVGPAPVDILRPSGPHRVIVRREGFAPYDAQLVVAPGEDTTLRATLTPERPSLFSRWWFWTIAGAALVGATTTTYLLTRPSPSRPEVDGGTLGWKVDVR